MKSCFLYILLLCLPVFPLRAQTAFFIKVDGTINPASSGYIKNSINKAAKAKAECLVIELNTPGGLLKSTRVIVSDILASPVPVIVYVAPSGSHAGSAGVFITLAAHVAAMAPGTNIGAAHPVNMQGQMDTVMNEKATNDAAAFIRSIAGQRKRNLQWAEDAVRRSVSITGEEAQKQNIIEVIARNPRDLLRLLDGRSVELAGGNKILKTRNAKIQNLEMNFSEKLLDLISDPSLAYILLLIGIYGIMFELYNPGALLPGIAGVISLILAFYALHTLPVNYAGVALIVFSIILFILEANIVSHGLLGIGGVISLFMGSLMLFQPGSSFELVRLPLGLIIFSTVLTALFFLFVLGLGLKAQRLKPQTGVEGLLGEVGETIGVLEPSGKVKVHGEIWNAQCLGGRIKNGEKVRISAVKNLTLYVERLV